MIFIVYKKLKNKFKKGSVLILALIMTSILLSVGMGISGIAMKEIKLSSIGDQSGKAFYMADTGAECALFWDIKGRAITGKDIFATSSAHVSSPEYIAVPGDIKCFNGIDITNNAASGWNVYTDIMPDRGITTFELKNPDLTKPCAIVVVEKRDTGGGVFITEIESRGRSSCDSNPRRVERGLKVSY